MQGDTGAVFYVCLCDKHLLAKKHCFWVKKLASKRLFFAFDTHTSNCDEDIVLKTHMIVFDTILQSLNDLVFDF